MESLGSVGAEKKDKGNNSYSENWWRGHWDKGKAEKMHKAKNQKPALTLNDNVMIIKTTQGYTKYKKENTGMWEKTNYVRYPMQEREAPQGTIPYKD